MKNNWNNSENNFVEVFFKYYIFLKNSIKNGLIKYIQVYFEPVFEMHIKISENVPI